MEEMIQDLARDAQAASDKLGAATAKLVIWENGLQPGVDQQIGIERDMIAGMKSFCNGLSGDIGEVSTLMVDILDAIDDLKKAQRGQDKAGE